jgi:hydrogenase maturation factor
VEESVLPLGKLSLSFLAELLAKYAIHDERVIVGPGIGEDTAIIDIGERYLVAKTDPITFATDQIGWYAVHVNVNDVATAGATPRWLLVTLLLPEGRTTRALVEDIFRQIHDACNSLNIALIGGHTEITAALDRPVIVGQLLGEVEKDRLVTTEGGCVGDDLILAKGVAIEGTAIIAREMADDLAERGYEQAWIKRVQEFLFDPGISVWQEAQLAMKTATVHAMHDPTEGGLATALHEMANAAETGCLVQRKQIPILPECQRLCTTYGLEPLGLIASGALLLAVDPADSETLVKAYQKAGVPAAVIGRLVPPEEGMRIKDEDDIRDLPRYDQDELTKLF